MQPLPPSSTFSEAIHTSRTWLIISGALYFFSGVAAIIFPQLASIAIVQVISFLLIITGMASLLAAIFSKHVTHRLIHGLLAFLRILIGLLILKEVLVGLAIFTWILAAFFLLEGIFGIVAATRLKEHKYWPWLFLNAIIALALGIIILAQYHIMAPWIIGLLYGVNAIFGGIALLLLGCGGTIFPTIPPHSPQ